MSDQTKAVAVAVDSTIMAKADYGLDVGRAVAMRSAVVEVMQKVMKEGTDFGEIPGTTQAGKKPKKALLQPGAEVLCQVFRLRPEYTELAVVERDDFISIKIRCRLFNSVTGEQVGEAIGSANSREDRYASQVAAKLCPTCGAPTIFKSKDGGWFCWAKKGGCGATFGDEDKKLLDQNGTVSVQRLFNLYHTLESIAQKRSFVKSTRTSVACSDIFTDEDAPSEDEEPGSGRSAHARTQPSQSATAAKDNAKVTEVQELTKALVKAQIGTAIDPQLPEAEYKELAKKAKLAWVNGLLEEEGLPKVNGFLELTSKQCADLTAAAAAGRVPKAW
jgi:hypothetical protein